MPFTLVSYFSTKRNNCNFTSFVTSLHADHPTQPVAESEQDLEKHQFHWQAIFTHLALSQKNATGRHFVILPLPLGPPNKQRPSTGKSLACTPSFSSPPKPSQPPAHGLAPRPLCLRHAVVRSSRKPRNNQPASRLAAPQDGATFAHAHASQSGRRGEFARA